MVLYFRDETEAKLFMQTLADDICFFGKHRILNFYFPKDLNFEFTIDGLNDYHGRFIADMNDNDPRVFIEPRLHRCEFEIDSTNKTLKRFVKMYYQDPSGGINTRMKVMDVVYVYLDGLSATYKSY